MSINPRAGKAKRKKQIAKIVALRQQAVVKATASDAPLIAPLAGPATARCPMCRHPLIARSLRGGRVGFPCPCNQFEGLL